MRTAGTVAWLTLYELSRNRLAMLLLLVFIPVWISLAHLVFSPVPLDFTHRSTGTLLQVSGRELTMISGSLNAVTLLMGFLMFSATRRARMFDRRLTDAGCPRRALLLAKLVALTVGSLLVAGWATLVMLAYWDVRQPWLLYLALVVSGLIYGGIGIVLGVFLPDDLEGMFTIIMVSIIDLALQNPIANPAADAALIVYLPNYGPMQLGVAAGFTDLVPRAPLLNSLAWCVGCGLVGLVVFHLRTRRHHSVEGPSGTRQQGWSDPVRP
ncbi:hypothetical protein [Actinoalloteichus caeruleus]|uniref:hypothetical protein n=1 Tax=Actinoalloteichus cyanogriseus TaxID=2893586 RepID=UPI0004AA0DE4|nr:hypothetical protein [Actinoalloteichus caeruleus]